jgi:hypothetical protein
LVTYNNSIILDVLAMLALNTNPFKNLFANKYDTPQKAYSFYTSHISDHLPVSLDVNL